MYLVAYVYGCDLCACAYILYVHILFCSEPEEEERECGPDSPTGLEERLEVLQQQLLALDQLPG